MRLAKWLGQGKRAGLLVSGKLREAVDMADRLGLLRGGRTHSIRVRVPEALVKQAKERTGINSDAYLVKVALANIAVADDYVDWLLSQRGTISPSVDLEF
jgi:hypothetical protein